MNIKRVAGFINLFAAVVFLAVGLTSTPIRKSFILIGAFFLVIGYLRLRKSLAGPPAP